MSNILIITILGLIIGSFLNVIILRFDDFQSILVGRSHCPNCKRKLPWYELVPVLSYIGLMGKCRDCKKTISVQYPLVELGTAAVFALIYANFGFSLNSLFLILISCILIVIFVYDILHQKIDDTLVVIAAALWITFLLIGLINNYPIIQLSVYLSSLYGLLIFGGFLALLVIVSKETWMGAGDIGLGALLGLIVGWPLALLNCFGAFFIGAIVGLVFMALKMKKMQSKLPFAPFMILAFWITLFWGEKIVNWYMNILL
jgi:leader peptidase (prepilin peptidase)/N-methyltransferase